ncbi:cadherin-99C isoform X2 [Contarinia nasturtii]|uniref:cadherin-99C isoform X2 n=1 Tax=Contarinia nasturtii TaxID=265458 RepID=UPI0012D37441|nr:cadherin-99C isoform X2 [Contarinia nasturtii]
MTTKTKIHWLAWLVSLNILLCRASIGTWAKNQLCEVETGQTNIILDIEESRGNYIDQRTTPGELPIFGDPFTEIALELNFPKGNQIFLLNGKSLQLLQPLDRDAENLSHIIFQVSCTIRSSRRRRNIPVIVRVSDINDNAPVFQNSSYETTVPESTQIGTTVFKDLQAKDVDAGVNGLVEYFIIEGTNNFTSEVTLTANDGYGVFSIPFPHQGQITLSKSLDYERTQKYYLTVIASDRARNVSERMTATTTVVINVEDSDDLDPSFIYAGCVLLDGACINPEYTASVSVGVLQGVLPVLPERIQAIDLDTISAPIRYTFAKGTPSNYNEYFSIDESTGILKHIKVVEANIANEFEIVVKAEEISPQKRFTTAKLTIKVKKMDTSPPMINATAVVGYVDENSAIGTKVLDVNGKPIHLSITDDDLNNSDPKPEYIFELTTPSFLISKSGYLVVNEDGLDRDPPNPGLYRFQLVAREATSNAASAPFSLTVNLIDKNDNSPKFPIYDPVNVKAGENRRFVAQITATDIDEGENAVLNYSIYHVSNNGMNKFMINEKTGVIETKGKLVSGEHYSITIQATDTGLLSSQTIVEVYITPGPNLRPPKFTKPIYEVHISEGAEINSTVVNVHAEDPENETISYSIVSGDDLRQFSIHDNGLVTVSRKLDREDLTRYQLIIRAEDTGGLSSSATINIKVTDINDKNPEFDDQVNPYVFNVDEGRENAFVGIVHAHDADEGINAKVTYYLPEDVPFKVNATTGEIRTKIKLDFETKSTFKFMITAKDGATVEPRIGTTMVTIHVSDIPDEVPIFTDTQIEVKVPENIPNYHITTVRAYDPDTVKQITYTLRDGRIDLFKIDSKTGEVKTIRNLDYETDRKHELIIGTLENMGNNTGDFVRVTVVVEDRNDVAPVFINNLGPITLNDDQPIGSEVAEVKANDGDGSYPGNAVRYEIVGRGKALAYFQIDSESAVIKIKELLSKDDDTEYQIDVRAYDLGEPQLSAITSLTIFVRHMTNEDQAINNTVYYSKEMAPINMGHAEMIDVGFSMDAYKCSISEAIRVNSTIKFLEIANINNVRKQNLRLKCEVTHGDENETFVANMIQNSCVISLRKALDYEIKKQYELTVTISSEKYYINPLKNLAKINIQVLDENDNEPEFIIETSLGPNSKNNTYYATVNPEAFIDTSILQVKAIDKDSGDYGKIKYQILDEIPSENESTKPSSYFVISEDTGVLKVQRSLKSIQNTPLIFFVEAIDNNGDLMDEKTKRSKSRIVINFLTDANRLALAFSDLPPKSLRAHSNSLKQLLSEKSNGNIVMIEGFSNRQYLNENGLMEENPDATDVWFYIIDSKTEKILDRNDPQIQAQFFEKVAQTDINYEASTIARATAQGIFSPVAVVDDQIKKTKTAVIIKSDVFPYTLIAIALLILIFGIFGIVYICISWTKYTNFKQRMRQYTAASINTTSSIKNYDTMNTMMANSRPNSQHSDTQSQLKEYETQVLAMAVNNDEVDDLQLDFSSKNHAFNLDNVSYITHKKNGRNSPTHSSATTAGMSTVQRNMNNNPNVNSTHAHEESTLSRNMRLQSNAIAPHAINDHLNIGSLTLGRIKPHKNNSQYGYGANHTERTYENNYNNFNTLGRNNRIPASSPPAQFEASRIMGSRLSFQDNMHDVSPVSNYYSRIYDGQNHSRCNENVTFGKRDYNDFNFMYLNGLDRSEAETTTEL